MQKIVKEKLTKKLLDTMGHKENLEEQKISMSKSLNEQIKGANRRIAALSQTIRETDFSILVNCGEFDPYELKDLETEN